MPLKIPVVDCSSKTQVVPDHFKIADSIQLALNQLGDGLFAFSGTITVGAQLRTIKEVNGEVIPGTGLNVLVRDLVGLADGVVLGDKNKAMFSPESTTTVNVSSAVGTTKLLIARAKKTVDSDGVNRPNADVACYELIAATAVLPSGYIPLAKITLAPAAVSVLSADIDLSVRKYLQNVDDLLIKISELEAQIGQGNASQAIIHEINIAKVNFKVDAALNAAGNDMFNGFSDIFYSDGDIDAASADYQLNSTLQKIEVDSAPGLAGRWVFNEASGALALDSSGNNIDATLVGSVGRVAGQAGFGSAIALDRNSLGDPTGYVTAGDVAPLQFTGATPFSIELWFKSSFTADYMLLVGKGGDIPGYEIFLTDTGEIVCAYGTSFPTQGIALGTSGLGLNNGAWHHVVVTYDGSKTAAGTKLYVDGLLKSTVTMFGSSGSFTGSLLNAVAFRMGSRPSGQFPFKGELDQVIVYPSELTSGQVATAFSGGESTGSFGGATSATVISKAHAAAAAPSQALLVADSEGSVSYSVSRDNGTTYTAITPNTPLDITGQPSGTQMRLKAILNDAAAKLDNWSLWWKP